MDGLFQAGLVQLGLHGAAELGVDGDGQIRGDFSHAVSVFDLGIIRSLQVSKAARGLGGDGGKGISLLQAHHKVHLAVAGDIDLAAGAASGIGHGHVLQPLAVSGLAQRHVYRGARVAGKGDLRSNGAAVDADPVFKLVLADEFIGHDLDRERSGYLGHAVGVFRAGVAGALEIFEVFNRQNVDLLDAPAVLEIHHKVDLAFAGGVDLAGGTVAGIDHVRVLAAFACKILGVVDRDAAVAAKLEDGVEALFLGGNVHLVFEIPCAAGGVGLEIINIIPPCLGGLVGYGVVAGAVGFGRVEVKGVHGLLGEAGEVHLGGVCDQIRLALDVLAHVVKGAVVAVIDRLGLVKQILVGAKLAEQAAAVFAGDIPAVDAQVVVL